MKKEYFETNQNFIDHLISLGFKEVTSKRDMLKGKREFKLRGKKVYFDYDNICLIRFNTYLFCGTRINKTSLNEFLNSK